MAAHVEERNADGAGVFEILPSAASCVESWGWARQCGCNSARDEGVPLPAGLILGTPEIDLTESGDSFHTTGPEGQQIDMEIRRFVHAVLRQG